MESRSPNRLWSCNGIIPLICLCEFDENPNAKSPEMSLMLQGRYSCGRMDGWMDGRHEMWKIEISTVQSGC